MAWQLKGEIAKCDHREYGFAQILVKKIGNGADVLFEGLGDELEVRGKVVTPPSDIHLPRKFSRSGCPMGINSLESLPTSTSSAIPPPPLSQPSPTTTSHGMVSSSTPRSPTLHAGEKSSESSFSISATVLPTGPWLVARDSECGRTLLMAVDIVARRNSLARKSRAFVRSVGRRVE